MATVMAEKTSRAQLTCARCMDLMNRPGEPGVAAKRCVQCGEVVDSVIQRNRQLRQEPTTGRQIMSNQSLTANKETP